MADGQLRSKASLEPCLPSAPVGADKSHPGEKAHGAPSCLRCLHPLPSSSILQSFGILHSGSRAARCPDSSFGKRVPGQSAPGLPLWCWQPLPLELEGDSWGALPGCSLPASRQAGIRWGQVLGPSCSARTQLDSPQLQASPMGGSCGPQSLLPPLPKLHLPSTIHLFIEIQH